MRKSVYTSLFTLLAFWIVASFAQAAQIVTEIKDGAKVYIRYNAGTDANGKTVYYYLNSVGQKDKNDDYGSPLVSDYHGTEFTLYENGEDADGSKIYALHASISNNRGTSTSDNDRFVIWNASKFKVDKAKASSKFIFIPIEGKQNTFKINFHYLSSGTWVKSYFVVPNSTFGNYATRNKKYKEWEVVTKEQLIQELDAATSTNPVDATFFISAYGFGRNVDSNLKAEWKVVNLKSDDDPEDLVETYTKDDAAHDATRIFSVGGTKIANYTWDSASNGKKSCLGVTTTEGDADGKYKVQQTLTGLPAGKYRVYAQGVSDVADACYLFALDGYSELGNIAFTSKSDLGDDKAAYDLFFGDDAESYKKYIDVEVYGGTLTIGVRNESAIASKAYVDNFELYYLGATAGFYPLAVQGSWTEVTSETPDVLANPQNYLFTIWHDAKTLVSLANGTDGLQGAGYKTMSLVDGVAKASDLNSKDIWEIYKTSSDKYVFVNSTSRENMLQTEEGESYFRFNGETTLNTSSAEATLTPDLNNTWLIETPQGYLRRWMASGADVVVDNNKGYFKLYATPRMQYVVSEPLEKLYATLNDVSTSDEGSSLDISLMISNPDAFGTNDEGTIYGWSSNEVKVANPVTGEDGRKSCFAFSDVTSGSLTQTLAGMPAGVYTLTAHVLGGKGTLFVGDEEIAINGSGIITVSYESLVEDFDLNFGVNASSNGLKIDYFTLKYSIPSSYTTEYYIRKNVGGENFPDYRYVTGGVLGPNAIFGKHGTGFLSVREGAPSTKEGFKGLQPVGLKTDTYASGTNQGFFGRDGEKFAVNVEDANKSVLLMKRTDEDGVRYNLYSDNDDKYLGGTNDNFDLYSDLALTDDSETEFEVVNRQHLIMELKNANPLAPVDATFFIDDPNFSKGNMKKSSWKVTDGTTTYDLDGTERVYKESGKKITIQNYGDNNNFVRIVVYPNKPTGRYYVQQNLTGLPKGYYRLSAQGIGRLGASGSIAGSISMYLFAKNGEGTETSEKFEEKDYFTAKSPASDIETRFKENNYENYKKTIEVYVGEDGNLTIGAKTGNKGNAAYVFDNFELYYIGEKSSEDFENRNYNYVPVPFDVAALSENMVEVTSATDDAMVNPQNYFFTIWENSTTCLALADGTDGHQGSGYKTMSAVSNPDLANDLSCLWEFDKTATSGKFVLVNMSDREHMMQTEKSGKYFRFQNSTALSVANASVSFESALYNNWAIYTPKGYAHREVKSCADVTVDASIGYYKIYAIPRSYYVMDLHRGKYNATKYTPKDVTLLLANPDGVGTSGGKSTGIPAWTTSRSKAFWTQEGTSDDFGSINGKSYFVYNHSKGTASRLSQTISNLLKGRYILSVSTRGANAGTLYLMSDVETHTTDYAFVDTESDVVEGLVNVGNGGTLTLGVTVSGKEAIMFDNFKLYYLGDENAVYAEPLKSGEKYYIRKNIGTESALEYRYLETGGSTWGTAGVIGEHGMDYTFVGKTSKVDGHQLFNLDANIGTGNNHFMGWTGSQFYNDKWESIGRWYFVPRGDAYPFQYRIVWYGKATGETQNTSHDISYDPNVEYNGTESNVILGTNDSDEYFEIVPRYQRIKEFEKATKANPVDATFLIKDQNFSIYNRRKSAWKLGAEEGDTLKFENNTTKPIDGVSYTNNGGGNNGYNVMVGFGKVLEEIKSFDVYQTITDIPNGHYIISASGVTTYEDGLKMYVTNGTTILDMLPFPVNKSIKSNKNANDLFTGSTASTYRGSIAVDVYNNMLVIGFKGTGNDSYSFFDNVEMVFCGESEKIEMTEQTPVDFEPKAKGKPWIEVTAGSDPLINPDDYLFAIWADAEHCLSLGNGTAGHQGENYKTMVYTLSSNPLNDVSQLWEFYSHGNDKNVIIVNASVRDKMLQAEAGSSYFRFGESAKQTFDQAVVSLKSGNYNNWRFRSETTGNKRELRCWDNSEVMMVHDRDNKNYGDYYKIYAIKRVDYYNQKNLIYDASIMTDADASLLIKNPGAFGEPQKELKCWTAKGLSESAGESFMVRNAEKRRFSAADGKTYFEFNSNNTDSITAKLYQDIHGLPHGNYLLKAVTTCAGANAKLFLESFKIDAKGDTTSIETNGEELAMANDDNIVQTFIEVPEGASLRIGVDFSNYQHIKSDDDLEDEEEENESSISVKFDKFVLQYMGVDEVLPSKLSDGVYFVRTNLNRGTDKAPEYRYLDAGGNSWGTDPILTKHGFTVKLSSEDLYDGTAYTQHLPEGHFSIMSSVFQTGRNADGTKSGYDRYFDGRYYDHNWEESDFTFTKVENGESEFEYTMYSNRPKEGKAGYIVKKDNNLEVKSDASGDAAAVWEIVTKTQRVKELQDASFDNPMDATFFITDPSFSRNNLGKSSWVFNVNGVDNVLPISLGDHASGSNNKTYAKLNIAIGQNGNPDHWNMFDFNVIVKGNSGASKESFSLSQKLSLENLPAGVYRLSVHGYTNAPDGIHLYAEDKEKVLGSVELHSINTDAIRTKIAHQKYGDDISQVVESDITGILSDHRYSAYWFTGTKLDEDLNKDVLEACYRKDMYYTDVEINVSSNSFVIGVQGELSANQYAVFDNFELYYLGEAAQDISTIEVDEDPNVIDEPKELYMYNVDAGLYLTFDSSIPNYDSLAVVKDAGMKFFVKPVTEITDGKKVKVANQYYIYTVRKALTAAGKDTSLVRYLGGKTGTGFNTVFVNYSTATPWTITLVDAENYIYEIKTSKSQPLEWTGDAANYVFSGYPHDENDKPRDKEPRGYRWSFYDPNQYSKDRTAAKMASNARSEGWRYVRSAIVNIRDLVDSDTIPGLSAAYNRLDASWINPLGTKSAISQLVSELKQVMIDALATRGTTQKPVDVSFFIQNAGLGSDVGWNGTATIYNNTGNSNKTKFIPAVFRLYRLAKPGRYLSQNIKEVVPAGKYMLSVDLGTKKASGFKLQLGSGHYGTASLDTTNCVSGTSGQFDVFSTPYLELDNEDNLSVLVRNTAGDFIVDNFKLYFGGNVRGKLKFNTDSTEVTMLGDWDDDDELYLKAKSILQENLGTLGAMHINKDNVILRKGVNVTDLGWQTGNNILFYTDFAADDKALDETSNAVEGTANIVRKGDNDSYSCDNLIVTDKMTMHVPYEFTATNVSYSRANPISTGTLCLPFNLTKMPEGITAFYMPEKIDWEADPTYGVLKLTEYKNDGSVVLPANTPVFYNGTEGATINVTEGNTLIHKTSELPAPKPTEDDLTMYGTYKKVYVVGKENVAVYGTKNDDGLSADECYYVRRTNTLERGKQWFNAGAFRAFVYRGKDNTPPDNSARASVLYIDFDDLFNDVEELKAEDAEIVGYYDVKGVRYDKPQKGFNVILYSDGTRRKVYVK